MYNPFDIYNTQFQPVTYKLSVETQKTYQGGSNTPFLSEETYYNYDGVNHLFPTKKIFVLANGKVKFWKYKYPLDYTGVSNITALNQSINHLKAINAVSPVIEEITGVADGNFQNEKVISAAFNVYKADKPWLDKNLGTEFTYPVTNFNESNVQSGNIIIDNAYKDKMLYTSYSDEGKLLEYKKSDDIIHSFIWGYNKSYPVAEITGRDYATSSGFVNQSLLDNLTTTDEQLRIELNKIRAGLAGSNSLIKTYTYKPLIGMTSQTDINNRINYYEYDNFNRLKLIKDQDGNILKLIDYKYTGQ
jgi:hypothetical protein